MTGIFVSSFGPIKAIFSGNSDGSRTNNNQTGRRKSDAKIPINLTHE